MNRNAMDRESARTWEYDVVDLGYNYRLAEPQAALGTAQLHRIEEGIKLRPTQQNYYNTQLSKSGMVGNSILWRLIVPTFYHLYSVKIKKNMYGIDRNCFFKKLLDSGIQTSVHYTPLHLMTFYKQFLNEKPCFPIAEKIFAEILSLPLYPTITKKALKMVKSRTIEALKQNNSGIY